MQARHVFKLLDIDYVHLPKISQSFKDSLPESTLLYNFTDQFIVGSGYTQEKISLSKMTFSHQMIRLIFVEQLYRAMTILNNGPYHHE